MSNYGVSKEQKRKEQKQEIQQLQRRVKQLKRRIVFTFILFLVITVDALVWIFLRIFMF